MQGKIAVLGLMCVLAGCTKVGGGGAADRQNAFTRPHELRYADISDFSTLNPMLNSQLTLSFMSQLTMAWLVRFDHDNKPVPELATEVPTQSNGGVSADGKTITFHLRKDAKWSDGVPFTADDVVFTTGVILDPKTNVTGRDGWDLITKLDEPDKYTVVFHLKKPYSPFIPTFFGTAGASPSVLPKHLLEHSKDINHDPYNARPVGIGPFKYIVWKRGDRVELEANPLYFRGPPKLKKITYRIIPSRDTLFSTLQTGEIDLWAIAPGSYFPRFSGLKGFATFKQPSYGFGHIDFNLAHPVLQETAVRRALMLAVDRRALREKVGHGIGILQDAVVSPASPYFDKTIGFTEYDPAKANGLLDAANWKRGADGVRAKNGTRLSLTFVSNSGSPDTDIRIELIRGWWKAIGVDFTRKDYPPALLFAQYQDGGIIYGGKFDAVLFAWFLSPTGDLSSLYACGLVPPNGQNSLHYCSKQADEAMSRVKATYDPAARGKYVDIVQKQLVQDVPFIVTAVNEDIYVHNTDLKNFHPNAVSVFDDFMNVDI